MCVWFPGTLLIEPKPQEPTKHQYVSQEEIFLISFCLQITFDSDLLLFYQI